MVKNLPEMQETWDQSLDQENPLEKGMATHSSVLVWRIPWTEELGGLQSMGSPRVGHDRATNNTSLLRERTGEKYVTTDLVNANTSPIPMRKRIFLSGLISQSVGVLGRSVMSDSSPPHGLQPIRLLRP